MTNKKLINSFWVGGFVIGALGVFIQNQVLIYTGPIVMGTTAIVFSKGMGEDILSFYRGANPKFARYLTVFAGAIFVIIGILGLLGV